MNNFFKILLSVFLIFKTSISFSENTKIKIGVLVPLSGENASLGEQVINSIRMALIDIDDNKIEIYPKDTGSDPNIALRSALELEQMGINLVIGPIFHKNLIYLKEVESITFLSLTNKNLDLPKNIISSGINSTSQLRTITKFLKLNELKKTILLIPDLSYDLEIKRGIKNSKIRFFKEYYYNIEPTKLTKQIEEITNYERRKQNLADEILRIENSDDINKENKIENLKKKYTLGSLKFDSIVIADFDESLKSVSTSLLYTDVSPENKYFITLNQWFNSSLLNEKDIQPIYYPSINKNNFDNYKEKFFKEFNEYPSHLSLLSYDLVGLVYYLSLKTNLSNLNKLFKKKNSFKGKIGIFDIKNNKINHRLNFYKLQDKKLIEIF